MHSMKTVHPTCLWVKLNLTMTAYDRFSSPGDLARSHIDLKEMHETSNRYKGCPIRCVKFCGAAHRRVFTIFEKPWRCNNPCAGNCCRGLTQVVLVVVDFHASSEGFPQISLQNHGKLCTMLCYFCTLIGCGHLSPDHQGSGHHKWLNLLIIPKYATQSNWLTNHNDCQNLMRVPTYTQCNTKPCELLSIFDQ